MILGVDFDNTLVCYDGLFYAAAVERGLMPVDAPRDKRSVRKWFVDRDREYDFTLLQGYVYGAGLKAAKPYPGSLECLRRLKAAGAAIYIVSHKTKIPHAGPAYDLRQAARNWLSDNGFHEPGLLNPGEVFFAETLGEKAQQAALLGCTYFIDDMMAFLTHPLLPAEMMRLLFQPPGDETVKEVNELATFSSWGEVETCLENAFDR